MPFNFGDNSKKKLMTCHPHLRLIANNAIRLSPYDFTIVWGWRSEEEQNKTFAEGKSDKKWPGSKHNTVLQGEPHSMAIDFAPWIDGAIPWNDTHIFAVIAGVFFSSAATFNTSLRWGGDWDTDGTTKDQKLMDWGHIELVNP